MGYLRADVVARVESRESFAELAADWFTMARSELFPWLDQGLSGNGEPAADGPPGGTSGTLWVQREPTLLGGSRARYSPRAWQRMLDGLAVAYPFHTALIMSALDEHGQETRPRENATIAVDRHYEQPEWVRFAVNALKGRETVGDRPGSEPYPAAEQGVWAEFVKNWARRADACFAQVTDDDEVFAGITALEQATRHLPERTLPRSCEVLRGYSWVTVCSAELAGRLGGVRLLAASGAFDEVEELPGGQVFLRATATVQEYEGEALRRVFDVLAPVLLTGLPIPHAVLGKHLRVVMDVNAADRHQDAHD
jgi:hypothetical protein